MAAVITALANPASSMLRSKGQIFRFAACDAARSPKCIVPLADAFRSTALDAYESLAGDRDSFLLSGRCADGTPDKEHAHAFYLPEVNDDGWVLGIRVVSPKSPFSEHELLALRSVTSLMWSAPATKVNVVLMEECDQSLFEVASGWQSQTPYLPPRAFHQRKPNLTPARQLTDELSRDLGGAAASVEATCVPIGQVAVRRARNPASAGDRANVQIGYRVRFQTTTPICGPVLLGHSAHFGMGQFRPLAGVGRFG